MIDVHTFYEIKLLSRNMSAEQVADFLKLSPGTVRTWRARESWRPRRSDRKQETKIGAYEPMICKALTEYPGYSAQQMYQMILEHGYDGKYTQVKEFVRSVRPKMQKAFLSINYPPGAAAQVDWGEAPGSYEVEGVRRKVYFFVMTMCYSRKIYVQFTLGCAREHFDECHRNAFEYFGGVPKKVIVDNCKTAILSNEKGRNFVPNPAYAAFAAYYGFKIEACTPGRPNEKGGVENGVKYVKGNFLKGRKRGLFEALNPDVKNWLEKTANARKHGTTGRVPTQVHEEELPHLGSLPLIPYDCCRIESRKVSKFFTVDCVKNRYSVPPQYIGKNVNLHIYPQTIDIYHERKLIAEHLRSYQKSQLFMHEEHERELLSQRRRVRDHEYERLFLRLTPQAEPFLRMLKQKRLSWGSHLRRIWAFATIYGEEHLARAIADAVSWKSCDADCVQNILESSIRLLPEAGPLHVSHKTHLLDLTIDQPNLSIYQIKGTDNDQ